MDIPHGHMEEEKTIGKRHIFIIVIATSLILTAIVLCMNQIPHNDPENPEIVPINPQNNSYDANATFVLASGNITFKCELADTDAERQNGLMNRESMDEDIGMLFAFDSPMSVSFWMKDTLIPLDIIFINQTGHVVNIEEADPEPYVHDNLLARYHSDGPVLYALEINQGISAAEGIVPGTHVKLQY